MSSLLIRNIHTLVTCDEQDRCLSHVDLYAEDGFIRDIGPALSRTPDQTLDASHMALLSGTH